MQTKCVSMLAKLTLSFRSVKKKKKQLDVGLKLKLNGKRLQPAKLNKVNAIISRIRHFDQKTLQTIYYAIFKPHL